LRVGVSVGVDGLLSISIWKPKHGQCQEVIEGAHGRGAADPPPHQIQLHDAYRALDVEVWIIRNSADIDTLLSSG
jgi:hypothetical protein